MQQYNLQYLVSAYGYIYMEIRKGMLGLKQSRKLDRNRLTKNLDINGYETLKHTPYLWRYHTSDLVFSLVVENFGINYTVKEDTYHMLKYLWVDYEITKKCTGEKYLGLILKWEYVNRSVHVCIPVYSKAALLKFQRKATKKPQDTPY